MIKSPIFIVGCPRSGTTLLFNVLSEADELWSIGTESKQIIEKYHHPRAKGWESGALNAADITPVSRAYIPSAFYQQAASGAFWRRVNQFRGQLRANRTWQRFKSRGRTNSSGGAISGSLPQQGMNSIRRLVTVRNRLSLNRPAAIRLLEKTPENSLRLPFLLSLFPDARVIYLVRNGRNNINSLLEGWRQPHLFSGYAVPDPLHIPDYNRPRWAFTLIPKWREMTDNSLAEICAQQWICSNEAILAHREETSGRVPYLTVRYEELIANPEDELRRVSAFIEVDYERNFGRYGQQLPQINVVSTPSQEKWRQNETDITPVLPMIAPMMQRLNYEG